MNNKNLKQALREFLFEQIIDKMNHQTATQIEDLIKRIDTEPSEVWINSLLELHNTLEEFLYHDMELMNESHSMGTIPEAVLENMKTELFTCVLVSAIVYQRSAFVA